MTELEPGTAPPPATVREPGPAEPSPLCSWPWPGCASFYREPEAVFWTFGFPDPAHHRAGHRLPRQAARSGPRGGGGWPAGRGGPGGARRRHRRRRPGAGRRTRRTGPCAAGRWPSWSSPASRRVYRFDPTRPESRLARTVVDDLLQRAAGRRDVLAARVEHFTEPGVTLRGLPGPGPAGHEHHVLRDVGGRLRHRRGPAEEAAQADGGHAHAPERVPPGLRGHADALLGGGGPAPGRLRHARLRDAAARPAPGPVASSWRSGPWPSPAWGSWSARARETARRWAGSSTW